MKQPLKAKGYDWLFFVRPAEEKPYSEEDLKELGRCVDHEGNDDLGRTWDKEIMPMMRQFVATKDPVLGMKIFVDCHQCGFYPPVPILDWLATAFAEMERVGGKKTSLDELLNLKAGGRGGTNKVEQRQTERDRYFFFNMIHALVQLLNVSIEDAAAALSEREETKGRKTPAVSWLAEQYTRLGKHKPPEIQKAADFFSRHPQPRERFLNSFPSWIRLCGRK